MSAEITGVLLELKLFLALLLMFLVGIAGGIIIMAVGNWEDKRDKLKRQTEIKEQVEKLFRGVKNLRKGPDGKYQDCLDYELQRRNNASESHSRLVDFVTRDRPTPYTSERAYTVKGDVDVRPPSLHLKDTTQQQLDQLRNRCDMLQSKLGKDTEGMKMSKELDHIWSRIREIVSSIDKVYVENRELQTSRNVHRTELTELWSIVKELKQEEHRRKNKRH